jgi:hypothetical protein
LADAVPPSVPRLIIAIDPGGTTGIAWQSVQPHLPPERRIETCTYAQLEQIGPCSEAAGLKELLSYLSSVAMLAEPLTVADLIHLIVEPFQFRHDDRSRSKIDYIAAEVVGALRVWCLDRPHVKFIRQSASDAKGFWTDDKIRRLGLWVPGGSKTFVASTPGKNHAMDALRHLLRYNLFVRQEKSLLLPLRREEGI